MDYEQFDDPIEWDYSQRQNFIQPSLLDKTDNEPIAPTIRRKKTPVINYGRKRGRTLKAKTIRYRCGHLNNKSIKVSEIYQENLIYYLGSIRCPKCVLDEDNRQCESLTRHLPSLRGTARQIEMAIRIRAEWYQSSPSLSIFTEQVKATWWIENWKP